MTDLPDVVLKIFAMFLVMAAGWFARWRGYLSEGIGQILSKLLVDLIFPALVFTQMLKTIDPQAIRHGWYIPLLGFAMMAIAEVAALVLIPFFSRREKKNTAVFLVSMPNWIYLPLPIIQGLFGDAGVRDILLYNVGFQVALWTIGIWTLGAGGLDIKSLRLLVFNPGLLATIGGILAAIYLPGAGNLLVARPETIFSFALPLSALLQAMDMLGSLTIPLSLLITGIQLGGLNVSEHIPSRDLVGVLLVRLMLAPLLTVAAFHVAAWFGLMLGEVSRITGYLIAAMPVAISCSIVTERFGGDTALAARGIFYSTLLSIVTVPAFYFMIRYFNL
jgi:predicted permease